MAFFGAGLAGLSQGLPSGIQEAGNLENLYQRGLDQAGQMLLVNTFRQLGSQQQPPMQPPMGGGAPPPQPQQMAGGQTQPQGSPQGSFVQPGMTPAPQMPQRTGGPPIGPPQQQPPQQQPPPQPGGAGPQGWGGGGFDIRQIIQQIAQANPGAPPAAIASAVKQFATTYLPVQLREQALYQAEQLGLLRAGVAMRGQDIHAETAGARMDQSMMQTVLRINNDRQKNLLPPLTPEEMQQAGMLGGGGGGGQPQQQPAQPSGPVSMGANPGEPQMGERPQGQPGQYPDAVAYLTKLPQQTQALLNRAGWDASTLDQQAEVYRQTGKMPTMTGMRGMAASSIQGAIRGIAQIKNDKEGITNQQMMKNWQSFHAEGKFQDTAATYGARVENAVNELKQLIPQAAAASNQYNRSDVVALNDLYNKWKQGVSDPRFNDLLIASFGTISAYVRAMNPAGTPRVADRLETEAIKLLSTSVSKEAYMTQLRRMWKEAQASQTATYETGKEGRKPGNINAPMPGDTGKGGGGAKEFNYDAQGNPVE